MSNQWIDILVEVYSLEKKKIQMRNIDVKVIAFEVLAQTTGGFFTIWATREAQERWNG